MEEDSILNIPCKVIVVGDSGVGKTSVIFRYINQYKKDTFSTVCTSFYIKSVIINNIKITFQLWDTVGQEKYRSVNNIFYKDAKICLMIYDITNENSFKSIKDYWYDAVKKNGTEGIIFGVAGNKNDLYIDENVDRNEVKTFCENINAILKFTSATTDECIEELFKQLAEKFIESDFVKKKPEFRDNSRKINFKISKKGKKEKNCCKNK